MSGTYNCLDPIGPSLVRRENIPTLLASDWSVSKYAIRFTSAASLGGGFVKVPHGGTTLGHVRGGPAVGSNGSDQSDGPGGVEDVHDARHAQPEGEAEVLEDRLGTKYLDQISNYPVAERLNRGLMAVPSPTRCYYAASANIWGESNSQVAEQLNKGLMAASSPSG
eukprot:4178115-Pyramimonas_sp.AAC.2